MNNKRRGGLFSSEPTYRQGRTLNGATQQTIIVVYYSPEHNFSYSSFSFARTFNPHFYGENRRFGDRLPDEKTIIFAGWASLKKD